MKRVSLISGAWFAMMCCWAVLATAGDDMSMRDAGTGIEELEVNLGVELELPEDALFLSIDPALGSDQLHRAVIRILDGGKVISNRTYYFERVESHFAPVVEIHPDDPEVVRMLINSALEARSNLMVEVAIDDQPAELLSAFEVVANNSSLMAEGVEPQPLVSIMTEKATWQCPNAHPGCDLQLEDCLYECFGDYYCVKSCKRYYSSCVYGSVVDRWVSTTLISSTPTITACVTTPGSGRIGTEFERRYKHVTTERRYCSGETYHIVISTTYSTDYCWKVLGTSCLLPIITPSCVF